MAWQAPGATSACPFARVHALGAFWEHPLAPSRLRRGLEKITSLLRLTGLLVWEMKRRARVRKALMHLPSCWPAESKGRCAATVETACLRAPTPEVAHGI